MILKVFVCCILILAVISLYYAYSLPDAYSGGSNSGCCSDKDVVGTITSDMYPSPRRDENVQDTYANDTIIKDPYRWMENPGSPETKKFIEDEMAITKPYLENSPYRVELTARFKELYNYPKFLGFFQRGNKFFSYQNTGLQNQKVLFIHDSFHDEGKVFIDPNTFSEDGTVSLSIDQDSFSEDGSILAFMTSARGSDWMTIQFKDVETGDIYQDKLTKVKFSEIAWTHDNKGIFYSAYRSHQENGDGSENTKNRNHKLYYHRLGTEQSEDIMVVEFPDYPDYQITSAISHCGRYLVVFLEEGAINNMIYIADLEEVDYKIEDELKLVQIVPKMEKTYYYLTNTENIFLFRTNKDADNYRIVSIDITNPDPNSWKDLVPADEKYVLDWSAVAYEKYMILGYIKDVKAVVQLHEIATGKMITQFSLGIGTVHEAFSNKKYKDIFFYVGSFLTPGIIYHCDLSNPSFELEVIKEVKLKNFDRNQYTTEQVFYKSKDGTEVPMYIVYKNGLQKNGNNPAFMTAYGGFGYSLQPNFDINLLVFIDNFDGVYAVPNIRGGGEYGEQWHRNGSLDKKQNSFDDFQAAAEFLIANNYTNSKLLAIKGTSNGGLLMGACLNQRPDLFGAVIANVGVMDMLRFYKFTIGHAWLPEYGKSFEPEGFAYLVKYSPLHNIKIPTESDKQYPATMVATSDHDDRVSPLHSLKFLAELQYQAKQHPNQKNPFILRVDINAGHGGGKPLDKVIADYVDMMCFIILNTGIKFHA